MHSFVDSRGSTWHLMPTKTTAADVLEITGIDVSAITVDHLLDHLHDEAKLAGVVFALSNCEADDRGICEENFGSRLAGPAGLRALRALLNALADNLPQPFRTRLRAVADEGA